MHIQAHVFVQLLKPKRHHHSDIQASHDYAQTSNECHGWHFFALPKILLIEKLCRFYIYLCVVNFTYAMLEIHSTHARMHTHTHRKMLLGFDIGMFMHVAPVMVLYRILPSSQRTIWHSIGNAILAGVEMHGYVRARVCVSVYLCEREH